MGNLLIFLAIAVAAAVAWYVVSLGRPAGTGSPAGKGRRRVFVDGLTAPPENLPPVLLPEDPRPRDVDDLRFSLGLRGYRMDQVDEVLDRLRDRLTAYEARIAELQGALATKSCTGSSGTAPSGTGLSGIRAQASGQRDNEQHDSEQRGSEPSES